MFWKDRKQDVHMVRHDGPSMQTVTAAVEGQESIFNQIRDGR
jgi:hypothetical protein